MINYHEYLKSNYWRYRRKLFYKRSFPIQCSRCKRSDVPLDIHHLRYFRDGASILFHELDSDLELICRACHEKDHNKFSIKNMNIRINWFFVLLIGIGLGYLLFK